MFWKSIFLDGIESEDEKEDNDDEPEDEALSGEENELEDQEDADIFNDPDFQNMSDSEGDDLPLFDNLSEDDRSEKDDGSDDEGASKPKERKTKSKAAEPTEVDDKFFKLRDMETFLDMEDRKEEGKETIDDEEDIDLFDNIDDEQEDIPAMYTEYFHDDQELDAWMDRKNSLKRNENRLESEENEKDFENMEEDNDNDMEEDNDVGMELENKSNKKVTIKDENILLNFNFLHSDTVKVFFFKDWRGLG